MGLMSDTASVCRVRFEAAIATGESLTVVWNALDTTHPDADEWASFVVNLGPINRRELGSPSAYTLTGTATAVFYGMAVRGTQRLLELADVFADSFRSARVAPVRFQQPFLGDPRREGPWWLVPVRVPFVAQEVI